MNDAIKYWYFVKRRQCEKFSLFIQSIKVAVLGKKIVNLTLCFIFEIQLKSIKIAAN